MTEDAKPFIVTRRVDWGDCDPAGIIYTPRVFDFAYESLGIWYRDWLGVSWWQAKGKSDFGSPTVHAECHYFRPFEPDDHAYLEIRIAALGRSSTTYQVIARDKEGRSGFVISFTACYTNFVQMRSADIPPAWRVKMEAYHAAWPALPLDEVKGC